MLDPTSPASGVSRELTQLKTAQDLPPKNAVHFSKMPRVLGSACRVRGWGGEGGWLEPLLSSAETYESPFRKGLC